MARLGFCGPSYPSYSPNVDAERCINYYPETVEGNGKSAVAMYPRPGLAFFANIPGNSVRCEYAFNGRHFAVGSNFAEIHSDGTVTNYTFLTVDSNPVTMAANSANQLIICSGGQLWLFSLASAPSLPFALNTMQVFQAELGRPAYGIATTTTPSNYKIGNQVTFSGITDSGLLFLNGQTVVVNDFNDGLGPSQFVFFSNLITSDYGPVSSGGEVTSPGTGQQFLQVNTTGGPFTFIDFVDEYFIALIANSQMFQISALNDGSTWNGLDVNTVSVFADNVQSLKVAFREVWLFGNKKSIVYYNTGNANNPLQPVGNGIMEQGIIAPQSPAILDNSMFWLGGDERGFGICWRANGYTPQRVSNHAVEQRWRTYSTMTDAVAWTYQDGGHSFYVLWFPSGNETWVYDAATQQWSERTWLNPANSSVNAWLPRCHAENFGKHLVGDRQSGNIYTMAQTLGDDAGNSMQFIRRAPYVSIEDQWMFHAQLQVDMEVGIFAGATTPPTYFVLVDTSGTSWSTTVGNTGALTTAMGSGNEQLIVLQDTVTANFYVLTVTTAGVLKVTPLNNPANYAPSITLSSPNGDAWLIQVTSGAIAVTQTSTTQPQGNLRWSDDGGHTWSNYHQMNVGALGQYAYRAIWRRLGKSRSRVYELSSTVPFRIVDAYLMATAYGPQPRLADQLKKGA